MFNGTFLSFILFGQVLDDFFFAFFMVEMLINMVALGVFGHERSYLSNNWNKFDFFINLAKLVSHNTYGSRGVLSGTF